ncbi:hypothetical protein [Clostridium tagluense]|uniref:Uncharacterized protein n=1 Tax=Clostridium tagluense TaxID=360422 RepID=A0A401UQ93_9CLOT|nr:hypothetical protein [Clostridium tagluense]GCD11722.1 hypothetical protein Ctaglu_33450 [Clostridium tagluense]
MKIGYINQTIIDSIRGNILYGYEKGLKVEVIAEYEDTTIIGDKVTLVRLIDEDRDKYMDGYYDYESMFNSLQLIVSCKIDVEIDIELQARLNEGTRLSKESLKEGEENKLKKENGDFNHWEHKCLDAMIKWVISEIKINENKQGEL